MPTTSNTACYVPPSSGCGAPASSPTAPTAGSIPLSSLAPGALPSGITLPVAQLTGPGAIASAITIDGSQITGTIPASALPPVDCKKTIACLTPGSIPIDALGSGSLPSGVTIPASALPPTTVSNTVSGSGTTRTLTTTVNGSIGGPVGIADVFPTTTVFSGSTGILTTTLNNGTVLTANIGITPVDQFLDTVTYVAATATLKLTMSNGTVKNVPLSDLVKVTTSGLAIVGDGTTALPVALVIDPASTPNVVSQSAAGLLITLPKIPAPWDCKQTIACLTPGSIPTSALAPGALPSGVTVSASALPPTTVSNTVSGSGAARTLLTTVNGVAGSPVAIPDLDAQTLTVSGQTLTISNGNSVTIPSGSAATTHTSSWVQSTGLTDMVNGVQTTIAIPSGVVTQILGYNASGAPVYQNYAPIKQFEGTFKSLPGNSTYNPVITTQTSNTMPVSLTTTTETLFAVTGPNQILVLGSPTSGTAYIPIGTVWDVKTTGNWVGPLTIQSPFAIDGLGSYVVNKIATQQPSVSLRWTGATWLIV